MKTPTLEEVKEYFKNAKEVRCLYSRAICNITKQKARGIHLHYCSFWVDIEDELKYSLKLWDERNGYASIISYKEEAEFTPIAMKCNQEQFEAIRPKLEKANITIHSISPYFGDYFLTNFYSRQKNVVSNTCNYSGTIYQTWNENIFLRACGIEVEEETFTVSKSFILEAHKSACDTWKSKIEKAIPDAFIKKPVKMTVAEIEERLGHKIEIINSKQ